MFVKEVFFVSPSGAIQWCTEWGGFCDLSDPFPSANDFPRHREHPPSQPWPGMCAKQRYEPLHADGLNQLNVFFIVNTVFIFFSVCKCWLKISHNVRLILFLFLYDSTCSCVQRKWKTKIKKVVFLLRDVSINQSIY